MTLQIPSLTLVFCGTVRFSLDGPQTYFDKDPWVDCALPVYFSMSLVWLTEIVSFILRLTTRASEGEGEGRHGGVGGERGKHQNASVHGSSKRLRSPWFKFLARGQQLRSYLTSFFFCHLGDILSIWDKGTFWDRATDDTQRFGANKQRNCRRGSEEAQPQLTSSLLALKVPGWLQQTLVRCLKSVPLSVSAQPALDHWGCDCGLGHEPACSLTHSEKSFEMSSE